MSALSHRTRSTALGVIVAGVLMGVLPAAAGARPDVHGVPSAPVNARGTDVAAPDQQVPRTFTRPHPSSIGGAERIERASAAAAVDRAAPVSRVDGNDDSTPTITLLALIALAFGLAGVGFASWLAVSRKRSRAAV